MAQKIDLFIIGAQKAGTTSLKNYLGEHPEMITHHSKEFSFFYDDEEYREGYEKALTHYFGKQNLSGKKVVCKHAHLYSSEKGIQRLHQHNPGCQIVFIMRNPVKRTLSSYLMEKLYNRVHFQFEDLPKALDGSGQLQLEEWQFEAIIEFGLYHRYLEFIFKYFKKEQVRLILFEDFSNHPLLYCREIFRSFGINDEFQPRVRTIHNKTTLPKSRFYASFLKYFLVQKNPVKESLKRVMPASTSLKLGERLRDANRSNKNNRYEMGEEVKTFLENYFGPHNKKLQELTGLDFKSWE
jgi:hypothetical protein